MPELQSSNASWYKIYRIQVKMKYIFRRSFTFGSVSCYLPMHLINITNSISIIHFLFSNQQSVSVIIRLAILFPNTITVPSRVS
jgi:hypothetical protein